MDERDRLLARYMVGRYRLGYANLALYLAGVLFEKLVDSKLVMQDNTWKHRLNEINLAEKIKKLSFATLCNDSLYKRQDVFIWYMDIAQKPTIKCPLTTQSGIRDVEGVRKRLQNFRWLRNFVMHGKLESLRDDHDNKKEDMINYVWAELAPYSFEIAYGHWDRSKGIIGSMKEHSADYMVRAIDEIDILPRDRATSYLPDNPLQLAESDFENLYLLRRKLVPLKNFLTDWLKKNAPFLITDILTTIDTTSAYIWLPLTREDKEKRRGILSCSVSILATPLDFRVYMDFGGQAYQQRELYYDFVNNSDEYQRVIDVISDSEGLEVFDIDWYCHITKRQNLSEWFKDQNTAVEAAHKKLKAYSRDDGDPLTWNRNLHGYILPKQPISFSLIKHKLVNIIAFYRAFQDFANKRGLQI